MRETLQLIACSQNLRTTPSFSIMTKVAPLGKSIFGSGVCGLVARLPKTLKNGLHAVLALFCLAGESKVFAAVAAAETSVAVSTKRSGQSLSLALPAGCTSCLVEMRAEGSTRWSTWTVVRSDGKPCLTTLTFPRAYAYAQWRATAKVSREKAAAFAKSSKFPASFYQGRRNFGKTPALGYEVSTSTVAEGIRVMPSVVASVASPMATSDAKAGTTTAQPQTVEADIWKTDGSLVYFFNQLRGLQVLDISEPSSPKLNALLRMPSVGQDMYLLPETTGSTERLLVLLVRDANYTGTEVVVVGVDGRVAREISRTKLQGSLSDSRMVGRRLYVVTTDWSAFYFGSGTSASTVLSEVLVSEKGEQAEGSKFPLAEQSYTAVICAGNGWLAVSTSNWQDWNRSRLSLFSLAEGGASLLTPKPVTLAGNVNDKFKVSFNGDVLTAVSLRYDTTQGWTPVSNLENFDVSGNLLGSLEIIRGEQLFATRFTGDKLYAVTFRRTDPLWIIDLSDKAAPKISGHVEVPGYSTYMEPMGDAGEFLFTIGMDSGKVAASLFDVSDVTSPVLRSRVFVDESQWGYSEAVYDEKALKVLPEEGLALIPFSASRWNNAGSSTGPTSFLRLVDISLLNGGALTLRGHLAHAFEPRRATLVNGILTSISQKELITASVDDRDHPAVLAEVALAWPVNQVIQTGDFLLQISDGSSALWSGEKAAVRISIVKSENSVLADIELGEGTVQDAVIRNSKLYVLRKNWNATQTWLPMVRFVGAGSPSNGTSATSAELALDIYDASTLPKLPLLGSVSMTLASTQTNYEISKLLWLNDTLPLVITQQKPAPYYWWGGGVVYDMAMPRVALAAASAPLAPVAAPTSSLVKMSPVIPSATRVVPGMAAVARPVDVTKPTSPVALPAYTLAGTTDTLLSAVGAGDGLLVVGFGENPSPWSSAKWKGTAPQSCSHRLSVIDFANPRTPFQKSSVVLPGRLFALGEISRAGFLAFSESLSEESGAPVREAQVSLVDGSQASLFATRAVASNALFAAEGRTLFVAEDNKLRRFNVDDSGSLVQVGGTAITAWAPSELQVRGLSVFGSSGQNLLRVTWPGLDPVQQGWTLRQWVPLSKVVLGLDRNVYVPEGDYGVDVLAPQ